MSPTGGGGGGKKGASKKRERKKSRGLGSGANQPPAPPRHRATSVTHPLLSGLAPAKTIHLSKHSVKLWLVAGGAAGGEQRVDAATGAAAGGTGARPLASLLSHIPNISIARALSNSTVAAMALVAVAAHR